MVKVHDHHFPLPSPGGEGLRKKEQGLFFPSGIPKELSRTKKNATITPPRSLRKDEQTRHTKADTKRRISSSRHEIKAPSQKGKRTAKSRKPTDAGRRREHKPERHSQVNRSRRARKPRWHHQGSAIKKWQVPTANFKKIQKEKPQVKNGARTLSITRGYPVHNHSRTNLRLSTRKQRLTGIPQFAPNRHHVIGKAPFKPSTNSKQTVTQSLSKQKPRTNKNTKQMTANPEQPEVPAPAAVAHYCGLTRVLFNKVNLLKNQNLERQITKHNSSLHHP
jgi:hypothetical protein